MNEKKELELNKENTVEIDVNPEVSPETLEINVHDKVMGTAVGPGQL